MIADIVIVFMNSARKNRAKRIELYSVLKPPTSSCSASTRSNGGRFELGRAGDEEDDERDDAGGDDVPVGHDAPAWPAWYSTMPWVVSVPALRSTAATAEAQRRLVGDHLRRGPHRAEQRVLRARRPAGEHDAVDRDRRHGQHEQDADRRVGQLQVGVVAEDRDDAVVAVVEVAADRARSRTARNAGHERQERRQHEHARGRPARGCRSSLKKSLMPSASVWSTPNGPARFGPMRFCMSPTSLRSNQIISIVATSSSTKTMTTLTSDDEHDGQVDGSDRAAGRRRTSMVSSPPSRPARR